MKADEMPDEKLQITAEVRLYPPQNLMVQRLSEVYVLLLAALLSPLSGCLQVMVRRREDLSACPRMPMRTSIS